MSNCRYNTNKNYICDNIEYIKYLEILIKY